MNTSGGGGDQKMAVEDPLLHVDLANHEHGKEASDFVTNLPLPVQRRIRALKKFQFASVEIEADFYRRVHELECAYAEKFKPLNFARKEIVTGLHEPTDEECDFKLGEDLANAVDEKLTLNGPPPTDAAATTEKGIPDFWLTVFRNVDILSEMIQEHDEPILKHLTDVEVQLSKDPMSFTLAFHFSPNDYFGLPILTKEYTLTCAPEVDTPFEFEGPEIVACKGCKIDWKTGKNVTVKLIKKKQKHKTKGSTRFVTKQVKNDSFFNFFDPPEAPMQTEADDEEETTAEEETRELLHADFEIGQILRDRVIPRAVLYFTGEAVEDEEFEDEDGEEYGDDEEGEEEDDEEDGDEAEGEHEAVTGGRHAAHGAAGGEKPQECKQQ